MSGFKQTMAKYYSAWESKNRRVMTLNFSREIHERIREVPAGDEFRNVFKSLNGMGERIG